MGARQMPSDGFLARIHQRYRAAMTPEHVERASARMRLVERGLEEAFDDAE